MNSGPTSVRWGDIKRIHIRKGAHGGDELRVIQMDVLGHSIRGARHIHHHAGAVYRIDGDFDGADIVPLVSPPQQPISTIPTFEQSLLQDDYALISRLKEHLVSEASYYMRLLDLALHPDTYATRFESETWSGATKLIDVVAPTPLEVMGSRIAFPILDQSVEQLEAVPAVERLISLPTRGIFAEGKLGHCNVAEEIDETRFWRWDEHPLPFVASDIAPVQPIQPKPQTPDLTPTTLPAPVVAIQSPVTLPDPTGMAAALKVLTTSDIFRDMSAKEEVQKLLGDLIEGSVSMAEAATKAQDIKSKLDSQMDKQARDQIVGLAQSAAGVEKARIEAESAKAQQVKPADASHAMKVVENAVAKNDLTKEEGRATKKAIVSNMPGTKPAIAQKIVVQFAFTHKLSGQFLEGKFRVSVEGPNGIELGPVNTNQLIYN